MKLKFYTKQHKPILDGDIKAESLVNGVLCPSRAGSQHSSLSCDLQNEAPHLEHALKIAASLFWTETRWGREEKNNEGVTTNWTWLTTYEMGNNKMDSSQSQ